jgi:hypothetical protein
MSSSITRMLRTVRTPPCARHCAPVRQRLCGAVFRRRARDPSAPRVLRAPQVSKRNLPSWRVFLSTICGYVGGTTGLAPAHLSRGLLIRVMTYRLQAEAFGDLNRKTVGLLQRMTNGAAEKLTADRSGTPGSDEHAESKISSTRAVYEPLVLKPGAVLTREWRGRLERVTVVDDGFAWNGATYASASAVAFAITGTKWNGHRFFGVRHRDGVRASERKDDAIRTYGRERPSVLARGKPINRPLAECDRSSPSVNATTDAGERDQ